MITGASALGGRTQLFSGGMGWVAFAAADRFPLELDAVGGVDEAIENSVGEGWAADDGMPAFNR